MIFIATKNTAKNGSSRGHSTRDRDPKPYGHYSRSTKIDHLTRVCESDAFWSESNKVVTKVVTKVVIKVATKIATKSRHEKSRPEVASEGRIVITSHGTVDPEPSGRRGRSRDQERYHCQ